MTPFVSVAVAFVTPRDACGEQWEVSAHHRGCLVYGIEHYEKDGTYFKTELAPGVIMFRAKYGTFKIIFIV